MHRFTIAFLYILLSFFSGVWARDTDSLRRALSEATQISEKIKLGLQLSELLGRTSPDSCLLLARKVEQQAKILNDPKSLHRSRLLQGEAYRLLGKPDSAEIFILQAVEGYKDLNDDSGVAEAQMIYGQSLIKQARFDEARLQLFAAIDVFSGLPDSANWALCLNVIGISYYDELKNSKAEEYFLLANKLFENLDNSSGRSTTYTNLGNIALRNKEYEKALNLFNTAIPISEELNDFVGLGNIYNNICAINFYEEDWDAAMGNLEKSIQYREKIGYKYGIAESRLNLGYILVKKGQEEAAIKEWERGLEITEEIKSYELMQYFLEGISDSYRQSNPEKAFFYLDSLRSVQKRIQNQTNKNKAEDLEAKYKAEQQAIEIELLTQSQILESERRENAERTGTFLLVGIVFLGLVIVIAVVFLLNLRKLNYKLKVNIQERIESERKLQIINEELNTLLHRSSHDIKSPLNSVQGLTILMRETEGSEQLWPYLDMIDNRLNQLKDFVGNILNSGNIDSQNITLTAIQMEEVIEAVLTALQNMRGFEAVRITTDIQYFGPVLTEKTVLQSAVQNLVSNSIKYRKKDIDNAWCRIQVMRSENRLIIKVEDNGIGISPENMRELFTQFSRFSGQAEGSGVGLYLVKKSLNKIGGTIEAESTLGKGTVFTVTLPIQESISQTSE